MNPYRNTALKAFALLCVLMLAIGAPACAPRREPHSMSRGASMWVGCPGISRIGAES